MIESGDNATFLTLICQKHTMKCGRQLLPTGLVRSRKFIKAASDKIKHFNPNKLETTVKPVELYGRRPDYTSLRLKITFAELSEHSVVKKQRRLLTN